ncbi:MAG: hypothetical protein R2932_35590 [Caldilineaceae bacterium]
MVDAQQEFANLERSAQSAVQQPSQRRQQRLRHLVLHVLLSIGALFMILPFLWMISTSLKAPGDVFIFPPEWIPTRFAGRIMPGVGRSNRWGWPI